MSQIKREPEEDSGCQQGTGSNHTTGNRNQTADGFAKRRKNNHARKNQSERKLNIEPKILQLAHDNPQASCSTTMIDIGDRHNSNKPAGQAQPNLEQLDEAEDSSDSEDFNYEPVLTKVLNEKKLALARSPEVIEFLEMAKLQSTSGGVVQINRST